jgi:hypothetical protein
MHVIPQNRGQHNHYVRPNAYARAKADPSLQENDRSVAVGQRKKGKRRSGLP